MSILPILGKIAKSTSKSEGISRPKAPFSLVPFGLVHPRRSRHLSAVSPVQRKNEATMATFKAIRIDKAEKGQSVALVDFDEKDLMDGDVTVKVAWSTLNYKDGLALTGKAPVVRRFPMIPGIDLAGTVEVSSNPAWKPGDRVILDGFGLGETHLGSYAQKARVKGEWLVKLPQG